VERAEISCEYIETALMVADCISTAVPLAKLEENKDLGLYVQLDDIKTKKI
jgi:hypothetical protein